MNTQGNEPGTQKDLFKSFLNRSKKEETTEPGTRKVFLERPSAAEGIQKPPMAPGLKPMSSGNMPSSPAPRPLMNQPALPKAPSMVPKAMPQNPTLQQNISNAPKPNAAQTMRPSVPNASSGMAQSKPPNETRRFLDFQAFQEENQKKQQETRKTPMQSINPVMNTKPAKPGIPKAKKYQDHRLGKGIPISLEEEPLDQDMEEDVPSFNRRLSPVERSPYHDQRLGDALSAPLPRSAGKGSKYQDHRLGPGIKQ